MSILIEVSEKDAKAGAYIDFAEGGKYYRIRRRRFMEMDAGSIMEALVKELHNHHHLLPARRKIHDR